MPRELRERSKTGSTKRLPDYYARAAEETKTTTKKPKKKDFSIGETSKIRFNRQTKSHEFEVAHTDADGNQNYFWVPWADMNEPDYQKSFRDYIDTHIKPPYNPQAL